MGNYLLLGDVHLADRPPSSCTDSYLDDLFDILGFCAELAKEYDAVTIQAGDLFHIKNPSRNSHALVLRTIKALRKFPEFWVVLGNHDISNDRLESAYESQPIGTVFASGAARELDGWMPERPVFGVPWLQRHDSESVFRALGAFKASPVVSPRLVVTHAPLYPPSLELPFEYFPSDSWAGAMGNHGSCYYGHVHEAHGSWTSGGVRFCNQGALSRGSLHEHNLTRELAVTLWNDLNGEFQRIVVPHKPASEVFRFPSQESTNAYEAKMVIDSFLSKISDSELEITSIESVMDKIKSLNLSKTVLDLIEDLLIERKTNV